MSGNALFRRLLDKIGLLAMITLIGVFTTSSPGRIRLIVCAEWVLGHCVIWQLLLLITEVFICSILMQLQMLIKLVWSKGFLA